MHRILLSLAVLGLLSLEMMAQPRLWGMTAAGGANNLGTVFSVNIDGSDFITVFDFDSLSGFRPEAGLCLAPNGLLYGTTTFGGAGTPAAGTLFTIDPSNGAFNKLIDFDLSNGGYSWATMIVGADGMLYGATLGGAGGGSIYRLDPVDDTYTMLYGLQQSADGGAIIGALIQAPDGWLYGTASQGGANAQAGTILRFDPVSNTFEKLHDFASGAGGSAPYGGLCLADDGLFYGTTFDGGANNIGIVYRYDMATHTFTKLHDFAGTDGANGWTALTQAGPDRLIGAVAGGGMNSAGALFSVTPSTGAVAVVNNFAVVNGSAPVGGLVAASSGSLYGTTTFGGTGIYGTLYRFDPNTYQRTTLHEFTNGADGGQSHSELAITGDVVAVPETTRPTFSISPDASSSSVTLYSDAADLPTQVSVSDLLGRIVISFTGTRTSHTFGFAGRQGLFIITVRGARGERSLPFAME